MKVMELESLRRGGETQALSFSPGEDTVRRQSSKSQEGSFHHNLTIPTSDIRDSKTVRKYLSVA